MPQTMLRMWDLTYAGAISTQEALLAKELAGWMHALCRSWFLLGRPRHRFQDWQGTKSPSRWADVIPSPYRWQDNTAPSSCQDRSLRRWNDVFPDIISGFSKISASFIWYDSFPRERTIPIFQISFKAVIWVRALKKNTFEIFLNWNLLLGRRSQHSTFLFNFQQEAKHWILHLFPLTK